MTDGIHFDFGKEAETYCEELVTLAKQRDDIERRMVELNHSLRSLARLIRHDGRRKKILEVLAATRRTSGLTAAISEILRKHPHYAFSANEVRQALEESGFDLSEYSQSLSTVSTTLRRLAQNKDGLVRRTIKNRNVTYQWLEKLPITSVKPSLPFRNVKE